MTRQHLRSNLRQHDPDPGFTFVGFKVLKDQKLEAMSVVLESEYGGREPELPIEEVDLGTGYVMLGPANQEGEWGIELTPDLMFKLGGVYTTLSTHGIVPGNIRVVVA